MKDYIIVGLGLSGAALAFRMEKEGRSFLIFDDESQQASKVAGGIINPVVLKRFTLAWKADEQMKMAIPFYREFEEHLKTTFLSPLEIYRRFSSVEEQNNWFDASDKPGLAPFLDTELIAQLNANLRAPYSFGRVRNVLRIDTRFFLDTYSKHLFQEEKLQKETFDYDQLKISEDHVEYHGITAKNVIFCEGFGLRKNPFFDYLPLVGNKGEYIIIKAPDLKLEVGIKSSVFIFPVEADLYAVGATYSNSDKSPGPTDAAKQELVGKLKELITVDFEVVDQIAGLRPSTVDRRPLVGKHPLHERLSCCNGFGSRGILLAPMLSELLLNHLEKGEYLPSEVDLGRFTRNYLPKKA